MIDKSRRVSRGFSRLVLRRRRTGDSHIDREDELFLIEP